MRYILIMWVMRTSSKLTDKPSFCGSLWMSPVNSCVDPHTMFTEYNQHSASVLETPRASLKLSRVKWIYLGGLWRSLQDERTDALLVAVLVHDYERMRQPGRYERKHNITIPPPTSAVNAQYRLQTSTERSSSRPGRTFLILLHVLNTSTHLDKLQSLKIICHN